MESIILVLEQIQIAPQIVWLQHVAGFSIKVHRQPKCQNCTENISLVCTKKSVIYILLDFRFELGHDLSPLHVALIVFVDVPAQRTEDT